jgi:hypothetical protein
MAFTEYTGDTTIIGALGTNPAERGLTTQEFKDKFDQFADEFVAWFNETHLPEVAEKAVVDEHKAEDASDNVHGLEYDAIFVVLNAEQSIPNNALTPVVWSAQSRKYGTSLTWDSEYPTRITVGAGVNKIRVFATTAWADSEVGKRGMNLRKNGGAFTIPNGGKTVNAVNSVFLSNVSTQQYLNIMEYPVSEGDYFELAVMQTSGSALNLSFGNRCTFMGIEVIKG